ncbi:MAG: LytTR family DNA-binding domain-containing protein [Reichenbachiella sp.]
MKVLIVEDEVLAAERLEKLLSRIDPNIEVLDKLDTVKATVEWYENHEEPDLTFFDIQLADGLSFEVFEQVRIKNAVIFTTAYDQYAIRAFEVNSIDYLLKPIVELKLEKALAKFKEFNRDNSIQIEQVQALLQSNNKEYKERFVVKVGEHLKTVLVQDVACFYSQDGGTFLATTDNRKLLIDYSIDQLTELIDPKSFFRINRKYVLNFNAIKDIITFSNSRLKIYLKHIENDDLIVARDRVGEFKSWLDR